MIKEINEKELMEINGGIAPVLAAGLVAGGLFGVGFAIGFTWALSE
ncbi:class IIb bacteriocin, lactobin A/cerein 7B family [Oceanivirga salmonicida]|nr:class IIb bacteriocin, lactobin A/cerein 7B family [Oceanivirga salmonicida]